MEMWGNICGVCQLPLWLTLRSFLAKSVSDAVSFHGDNGFVFGFSALWTSPFTMGWGHSVIHDEDFVWRRRLA
jgi:hypothetical protein